MTAWLAYAAGWVALLAGLAGATKAVVLGFATLTSSTSYYEHAGDSISENTGFYAQAGFLAFYYNYPRPMASAVRTYSDEAFVQELRLVSNTEGKIDYVAGLYYLDQDLNSTQQSFLRGFKQWWDTLLPGLEDIVSGDKDLIEWTEQRPPVVTPAQFEELLS